GVKPVKDKRSTPLRRNCQIRNVKIFPSLRGAIAQLGERIVRNDEVVGSIPTSSTIFDNLQPQNLFSVPKTKPKTRALPKFASQPRSEREQADLPYSPNDTGYASVNER